VLGEAWALRSVAGTKRRIKGSQARRAATARVQPCPTLAVDDNGQAEINMDATTYSALGQPGVGFFMAIIIGALAGWLAEKFTRSDMGLFANIIMGIIGAVVGNFLARLLGIYVVGFWGNLISATVGAILVIVVYRAIAGRRTSY
jgi:uncharacterized membrane protein YeaQ/YmgE (transglycosylase-associated protein family)